MSPLVFADPSTSSRSRDSILVLVSDHTQDRAIRSGLDLGQSTKITVDPAEIVSAIAAGHVEPMIVMERAMTAAARRRIYRLLLRQPLWSHAPLIILVDRKLRARAYNRLVRRLDPVIVLAWPSELGRLGLAVQMTLRARDRRLRSGALYRARLDAEKQALEQCAALKKKCEIVSLELSDTVRQLREAEDRIRKQKDRYRLVLRLNELLPWTANLEGRITAVADAWTEWSQSAGSAFQFWRRAIHPDDLAQCAAAWNKAVNDQEKFDNVHRLQRADGQYRWYRARAAHYFEPDGDKMLWYGTIEDVHEHQLATARLQQTQAELVHVARLGAMGTMASTIAHELNQPLVAIANYVRSSRRLLEIGGEHASVVASLTSADRAVVRAGEIVRRVRELVRNGAIERRAESLPAIIDDACRLALIDAHLLKVAHTVIVDPAVRPVLVDRIQIQQVLVNLVRNSIEALQGQPEQNIIIEASSLGADLCQVTIRDTGSGVCDTALERLFGSFNTSKIGGIGIGLSISRTIVEAHGGQIWYQPNEPQGAVFSFTLPYS